MPEGTAPRAVRQWAAAVLLAASGCAAASSSGGNGAVYDAWRTGRSHVEVEARGSVARVLGERAGRFGPHEGFLLHLTGAEGRGLTVRVEVNEAFTGRIPLVAGETVGVRGEYEFDRRGGVIHWTHRDPRGRHPGGYIQVDQRRYG